jgi:hypothetical protein
MLSVAGGTGRAAPIVTSRGTARSARTAFDVGLTGPTGLHAIRIWAVAQRAICYPFGEGHVLVGHVQRLAECLQLAVGQIAERPARNRAELERANPRPDQLGDRVADLVKHLADDPVAALVDDDADDRAVLGVANRADHLWNGALAVDRDAPAEPVEHLRRRIAVEQRLVLLVDPVAGMHDTVGNFAVVRQQEQAFSLPVEPADRHDTLVDRHEVHDGVAAAFVGRRRNVAAGLVEQDVAPSDGRDQLAIDFDLLGGGIDFAPKLGDDFTVHTDAPFEDQLLGAPPGRDAC